MKAFWLLPLGGLLVAGCPPSHLRPTGPPPEYEKPVLPAWEAAAPVDPFESLGQGGWLDETGDEDAGSEAAPRAEDDAAPASPAPDAALADAAALEAGEAGQVTASRPKGRASTQAR
jgi:hypothetical protein